tara:strand:- start:632 stop:1687 length:1056 start_codon:yes stop_codon:yes gene_type:complete
MMIAPRLKGLLQICAIGVLLCSPLAVVHGQNLTVFSDSPEAYVVKDGDTLWDIASLFLDEPWRWPEIWQKNPAVQDPDLIYPGDVLNLVYVDGSPRVVMERGNRQVVRLSPQVRESPLLSPIPVIARQALRGFLAENRIVEKADYDSAPYILASATDNLIMGAGHEAYVRGDWTSDVKNYEVFRLGAAYIDQESDEFLGQEVINLGEISIVAEEGDGLKRGLILSSKEELKAGDRLLPRASSPLDPSFFPSTPSSTMQGQVVGLLDNKSKAAQFESIVIDLGARDGLRVGDILSIERAVAPVRDPISNKPVALPATQIGLMLTYRTFEKLSYGVILSLTQPSAKGDVVSAP